MPLNAAVLPDTVCHGKTLSRYSSSVHIFITVTVDSLYQAYYSSMVWECGISAQLT